MSSRDPGSTASQEFGTACSSLLAPALEWDRVSFSLSVIGTDLKIKYYIFNKPGMQFDELRT